MAEKRMVVENEGVGRVKEECGIYRRCQEWGHLCSTFILSGASAVVRREAAVTWRETLQPCIQDDELKGPQWKEQ
jgi:hypothetical protein